MSISLRFVLILLYAFSGGAPAGADNGTALTGQALVQALQSGGYNIYFRHAQTDWSQHDHIHAPGDWASCDGSRVRQLAEEGRAAARTVGDAMRTLGIPVAEVFASPYCRTVETAKLMGLGPVETTTDIMNLRVAEHFGGRAAIVDTARRRLAIAPRAGTNRVLVAHGNVARAATQVYPDEAEAIIFRPDGNGDFTFVGRLKPAEWEALAGARR